MQVTRSNDTWLLFLVATPQTLGCSLAGHIEPATTKLAKSSTSFSFLYAYVSQLLDETYCHRTQRL